MLKLKRLWVQLTSDKRRFAALCTAVAVGLLLWARLIVITNMPKQAVAENDPPPVAQDPPLSGNLDPVGPLEIELSRNPSRDPFAMSRVHYPELRPDPDPPEDGSKSGAEPTESLDQTRARRQEQLRAMVETLTLDAVITGNPLAVIDGRPYRLGQWVPADDKVRFELFEVRARSALLRYDGFEFELRIAPPGRR